MTKVCSVDECETPAKARSLCSTHYMRIYRHGYNTVKRSGPKSGGSYMCPACSGLRTSVKSTKPWRKFISRRRACWDCSNTFTTVEVPAELFDVLDFPGQAAKVSAALTLAAEEFNVLNRNIKRIVRMENNAGARKT